jgi:hypothetical protein
MADSDKNIIITPNRGATSQPQISFTGQGNDPITIRVLDGITGTGATAGGALSVEGSAGQLFSIVNRLGTGSIFSVNDISGIPSIDVDANGTIVFAGFTGNVGIGVTAPAQRLSVAGNISATGLVTGSRLVYALNGLTGGVTLNAGSNVTITSSVAGGITIASSGTGSGVSTLNGLSGAVGITAGANVTITVSGQTLTIASTGGGSTDVVTSFNGRTGAVQGVSAAVAGDGITVSGATGAVTITNAGVTRAVAGTGISVNANTGTVTITNIGVQSFNGLTGAVGGVCAAVNNTFTATQSFAGGICMSVAGLQSSQTITVNSASAGITNAGFLYVGGGATFNSSLAVSSIVSPGATLTVRSGTQGGSNRDIRLNPYGQVIIDPLPPVSLNEGSTPKIVVQNLDDGSGLVQISGGNLYLGTRADGFGSPFASDIVFANPSNAFFTTVTASTSGSNKTITLPNNTGTVALTNGVVTVLNGISGAITLNAGSNVTITSSVAGGITIAASGGGGSSGVTTFNGLTGDVTGTSVARHWFI